MINLLRSLHDGMEAEVTISSFTSPSFSVTNGCTNSKTTPTLFALYHISIKFGETNIW